MNQMDCLELMHMASVSRASYAEASRRIQRMWRRDSNAPLLLSMSGRQGGQAWQNLSDTAYRIWNSNSLESVVRSIADTLTSRIRTMMQIRRAGRRC